MVFKTAGRWWPPCPSVVSTAFTEPCWALKWHRKGVALSLPVLVQCVSERALLLTGTLCCPEKIRAAAPRGWGLGAWQMPPHQRGWGEARHFFPSSFASVFPIWERSSILEIYRLLPEFRWIRNFSPILFRDVQKTSSISPHMYSIKRWLPWVSVQKPQIQYHCPSNCGPSLSYSRIR